MSEQNPSFKSTNIAGIMTGNSMDAADIVLTEFGSDGAMRDLGFHSKPYTTELYDSLWALRDAVKAADGNVKTVYNSFSYKNQNTDDIHDQYIHFLTEAISEFKAAVSHQIDSIASHGQNLAHYPPSIAGNDSAPYTVQIGCGYTLSKQTGYPVVFDFRSDDVLNGGEGAPLSPIHHRKLAKSMKQKGRYPVAFCNAGNTGNISILSRNGAGQDITKGWDTGPFNYFSNQLMTRSKSKPCDINGLVGQQGKVNLSLLKALFDKAVINANGDNYLLLPTPKSSDGQWYRFIPELLSDAIPFADKMRTVQYFSAYIYVYSLIHLDKDINMPHIFALCGGGWKNPVCKSHFEALLQGNHAVSPVLEAHKTVFDTILARFTQNPVVNFSDIYGFSGDAMEARLFAHMAADFLQNRRYTTPEVTGAKTPTRCGLLALSDQAQMTETFRTWLGDNLGLLPVVKKRQIWSRAAKN